MIPIRNVTGVHIQTKERMSFQFVDSILIGAKAIFVRTLDPLPWPQAPFTLHVYGPTPQTRFSIHDLTYGSKSVTGYHVLVPNDTTVISLESFIA